MSQENSLVKIKNKVAFTTVLDDKYLSGFLLTLNSLIKSSENFNYDIVVFEWGELSKESINVIQQLYQNVFFKKVQAHLYHNHKYDSTHRIWTYNCNYRFDIFTLTEYDRVVFFDSDILFQIDVEELLKHDVDFGACVAQSYNIEQIGPRFGFDGGLMSVGKKFLNETVRLDLINIANSEAPFDNRVSTRNWVSDEPILNTYFLDKITWLDEKYNFLIAKLDENIINKKYNFQFAGHNKPWYGTTLREQFSNHVFESILVNTGKNVLVSIILKKLYSLYNFHVKDLKEKGIDIYKYSNHIKPSLHS
jgi:lipopolysaccharide biosynthesis glycosyltransferase